VHKLEFSKFDGMGDLLPWLNRCERYFRVRCTPNHNRVAYVAFHWLEDASFGIVDWSSTMVHRHGRVVSSWTLTLIEREDATRSWGNFSGSFLTQCHTNLWGWGYIFIAGQDN
jgi:hypothetical protein